MNNEPVNQPANQPVEAKPAKSSKSKVIILIIAIVLVLGVLLLLVNKVVSDKKQKGAEVQETAEKTTSNILDILKKNDGSEASTFNATYELYSGTKPKLFVIILVDHVITNNKNNSDHIITMVNGDINSSDPEEIAKIKDNLTDNEAKYEVTLGYDDNGYVNKITIE